MILWLEEAKELFTCPFFGTRQANVSTFDISIFLQWENMYKVTEMCVFLFRRARTRDSAFGSGTVWWVHNLGRLRLDFTIIYEVFYME